MLLKNMLKYYSPTGNENKLVDFLVKWANDNGFNAYRDNVGNFIAKKGKGKEILLVGHVDTVSGKIPVKTEGNKLYGRGAVDAKGPLACFLEASKKITEGKIIIVGVVDEEGESKGAKNILNKFNPEYIIVGEPSGWSNMTIGYKGRLNIFYANEESKKHSSSPDSNFCEETIEFYNKIKKYCEKFNHGKKLFEKIDVKILSINTNNDDFTDKSTMKISMRTPLDFEIKDLKNFVKDNKKDAAVTFSSYEEAVKVNKNNKLISIFIGAIRTGGGEPKFKLKMGTSDMNILQKYRVPILTYGPGDSNLDHTPDEHINLDEYEKSIFILKNALEKIVDIS
ncbi:hypothetical protein AYK24_00730 [Thermoplasmatales archaeon SG8-52-4]|nr:MAG: hypothetical protein AYK24_00730 [Thermoplasmatales archaeon SG8-52-4]